jgi:hypothetical protein
MLRSASYIICTKKAFVKVVASKFQAIALHISICVALKTGDGNNGSKTKN